MSQYPSLPLFTDAFIADTGHLPAQETGAYLMLLMMAWRMPDCRLPDDDAKLARWARVDGRTWRRIKAAIMEFWTLKDGYWEQRRLSKEREIVSKRAEVARENGKHGGRPKSLKRNHVGNQDGSAWVTHEEAPNPNPNPKEEKETTSSFPPTGRYAFEATTIKLTAKHLEDWQRAHPHIAVESELWALDEWAGDEAAKGKNWFHAVSAALAKREREATGRLHARRIELTTPRREHVDGRI